jgi:geranylgeranylglycerol-phosphate geranylgeranyltransferase
MNPYLHILRPHNCLISGAAVVLGVMIAGGGIPLEVTGLAGLVAFLICGAGNIINDYYDLEIDRVNRPHRPLPSGKMGPRTAVLYAWLLFTAGIALSVTLGPAPLALALFNSLLLYAYAWRIKMGGGITKNLVVSYLVASPFLFGGMVARGNLAALAVFLVCAFLLNTSREIIKDIEDLEGDRGFVETFPMKIGEYQAFFVAGTLAVTAVMISPLPGILGFLKNRGAYLLLILLTDAIIFYPFLKVKKLTQEKVRMTQKTLKAGMAAALVAFFFGTL